MIKEFGYVIILSSLFICLYGNISYKANVEIINSKSAPNSILYGDLYFTNENNKKIKRIDYISPSLLTEVINYDESYLYKYCDQCNIYIINENYEALEVLATDIRITNNFYKRSGNGINEILTDNNGLPTKIKWKSGQIYNLYNISTQIQLNVFEIPLVWNCPTAKCRAVIDLALVVDASSSITNSQWKAQGDFIELLLNEFILGPEDVMISVIFFTDKLGTYTIMDLSSDKTLIMNAVRNGERRSSGTCIGCGILEGIKSLENSVRLSLQPMQMMITFTDGANNMPCGSRYWTCNPIWACYGDQCCSHDDYNYNTNECNTNEALNYLKTIVTKLENLEITSIAVGVANAIRSELELIASEISNISTIFQVNDYSNLKDILGSLIKETCKSANITTSTCSSNCLGFCGCNDTCICPNCYVDEDNECSITTCEVINNYSNGCTKIDILCNQSLDNCYESICIPEIGCSSYLNPPMVTVDCNYPLCINNQWTIAQNNSYCVSNNKCKNGYCDIINGCIFESVKCPVDFNKCHNYICDENIGCILNKIQCDNSDKCHPQKCEPDTGLCIVIEEIKCETNNSCEIAQCNSNSGACIYQQVLCDDNNPCTNDYCNPINKITYECIHEYFDCGLCENYTCDQPIDNLCITSECRLDTNYEPYCHFITKQKPAEFCKEYICDPFTGEFIIISQTPEYIPQRLSTCSEYICNNKTGFWSWISKCEYNSPCDYEYCDEFTEVCKKFDNNCVYGKQAINEYDPPCSQYTGSCIVKSTLQFNNNFHPIATYGVDYICETEPIVCTSNSLCMISIGCLYDKHNNSNDKGKCETIQSNCNGDNWCKEYGCDPLNGCTIKDKSYIGIKDPCKKYICNSRTKTWNIIDKCISTSKCVNTKCNAVTGKCMYTPIECEQKKTNSSCHYYACDSNNGCVYQLLSGAFINNCNDCIILENVDQVTENMTDLKYNCGLAPKDIMAITGGALATLILAILFGLIILLYSGYRTTKEIIRRANLVKDAAIVNNPFNESNTNKGTNPMYELTGITTLNTFNSK